MCVVSGLTNVSNGLASATVNGRIVGHKSRRVQKYIVTCSDGLSVIVGCENIHEQVGGGVMYNSGPDRMDVQDGESGGEGEGEGEGEGGGKGEGEGEQYEGDGDAGQQGTTSNASGTLALQLQGRVATFDVGKMSAHDIWHTMLLRRELSGGMLTRTILIAAASDSQCLPLWPFGTKQEHTVEKKRLQGIDFIDHFQSQQKVEWLRVKVFSTVSGNRNTYAKLIVTFNGCTSLSLAAVSGVEVTDDLRCRVAHLALDAQCVKLLCIIFGSRDSREKHDNSGLKSNALWDTLTKDYVNNPLWQPYSPAADKFHACCRLDPGVAPARPGLQTTIVQDIFLEGRTDWTRLESRVSSPTGCNSTGDALLNEVWQNFINGGRLKFTRPTVIMYIFVSWHAAGKDLPELCSRQLARHQQLMLGVGTPSTSMQTPEKNPSTSTPSPKTGKGTNGTAVDASLQMIANVMHDMQASLAASQRDLTPAKRSLDTGTLPPPSDAPPPPDEDLRLFMTSHGILRWWPQIFEKLGITSVQHLRFIGKKATLEYLTCLPALPALKLAELADTNPEID